LPLEHELPRWPIRLALSVLVVIEIFFLIKLFGEGGADNVTLIMSSVGIVVFCVLTWRGSRWSRWLLLAFLVWRLVEIGIDASSHFAPDDRRIVGTLILVVIYLVAGSVIASPLGHRLIRAAG